MGINIAGAVEVRGVHPNAMSDVWQRFATLEIVYLRSGYIYESVFGVSGDGSDYPQSLFPNRGLPADATDETLDEHERWAHGQLSGKTMHDTWFTWDEMQSSHWLDEWDNGIDTSYRTARAEYNWAVMFHMIRELASFYGPENVRVVAWFAW